MKTDYFIEAYERLKPYFFVLFLNYFCLSLS